MEKSVIKLLMIVLFVSVLFVGALVLLGKRQGEAVTIDTPEVSVLMKIVRWVLVAIVAIVLLQVAMKLGILAAVMLIVADLWPK